MFHVKYFRHAWQEYLSTSSSEVIYVISIYLKQLTELLVEYCNLQFLFVI